jgi:uncharacterized RDD family membrane protein YckC
MTNPPPPSESPAPGAAGGQQPSSGGYVPGAASSAPGSAFPPPPSAAPGGSSYPPPPLPGGGSYPPPPPSAGGYAPPPPGPAIKTLPTESYASWITRVAAFIIDILPYAVVHGIGYGILLATQQSSCVTDITQYAVNQYCVIQNSTIGWVAHAVALVVGLAYLIWDYGYRQGTTGSSLGKSVTKVKVVSEVTGQPIGFGMSLVRQVAHFIDAVICFIGFLFPLWDAKRQTLADKIMTTVVLPTSD